MRKNRFITFCIMIILILSSSNFSISLSYNYVIAGSPSSGDIPPPSGEGPDTGGGSASGGLYLNYRIPLIFRSGPFAPSLIAITSLQNGTPVIFDFESTQHANNTAEIGLGETLILDPTIETNMENGSLIQSFTPLQINVYHSFSNSSYDDTFSYAVLVMSMWGKKYQSPYDNVKAKIIAGYNLTEVDVISSEGVIENYDIPVIGQDIDVDVSNGTRIEASGPIGVVYYSLSEVSGSFAYTGIPSYLWGKEYFIYPSPSTGSIPALEGEMEIAITSNNEGENLIATTNLANAHIVPITENSSVRLSNDILGLTEYYKQVSSFYVNISLTVLYNYTYNGVNHLSSIQYIAVEKMRWAELFFSSLDYENVMLESVVLTDNTPIIPLFLYDGDLYFDEANYTTKNEGSYFTYFANNSFGILGNGSFYSYMLTPLPESEIWNSSAHILYPLNLYSYFDNTSTYFPSWYRFPNINVREVIISPSKPTEFRRLQLDIMVQNNGTIPSAPFWVTVYVNDTLRIHTMLDGLDINQSIPVIFEEFQSFGLKILNVSIFTDSQSQIFELLEFDNALEFFVQIHRNWNIIYTAIAIGVVVIGSVSYWIIRRIRKRRKRSRTRFDVILSEIEV